MGDEVNNAARPPAQKRLGPILLSPGWGTKQVVAFLFVICISQSMNEFANVMTPLVLGQQLHLPKENQGSLVGMLGATQQFGTLLCILAAGALADMFGRRVLLLYTLTGYFICLLTYPFLSTVFALFLLRFAWGVFFTGYNAGAPTLSMDIPDNNSRGKFNSLVLLAPLLVASAFVLGASRLPALFRDLFSDPQLALTWTFGLVSIIPLIGAASTILFFKEPERRSPGEGGFFQRMGTIFSNIRSVLAYAGKNKKFGVMLFIGSVVRTDTLIIGSFLGLWVVNAGREGGIDAIEATKTAGLLASIRFGMKILGSPLFGFINDKVNRVALMLIALAMMTLAFAFFGLITDVFGVWMIVAVVLIGFAESAEALASQTLLAQEAPPELRGSSVGVFTFLGTISLLLVNLLGGYLFDKLGYSAPFMMEAALHLLVLVIAVIILRKGGAPAQAR
jgi:MFS family permease